MADKGKKSKEGKEGKEGKGKWFKQGKRGGEKFVVEPPPVHVNGAVDQELLDAAEQGDLARVKALVEAHRDDPSYINACDKMGASALHCAAMGPHLEVCEYLISEGANVSVTNTESTTPLHYIVRKAPRKTQHYDEANPPAPLSLSDMLAGRKTPYVKLLDLMLDKGASIDAQSIRSETPLHQACTRTNEEAVRWLLANNAELHITNKMKETPLATLRGQECYIAELLELADTEDTACTMRGLLTWGFGGHGLLGYNVTNTAANTASNLSLTQPTPRQAPDALSFTPLNDRFVTNTACGSYVTAALTSSEEVFVWGRGRGSSVSGADHWYLLGNGQQENDEVTPVLLSLPPIAKVSLGVNHGAVVSQDGGLMTWGFGGHGQLGRGDKKNLAVPTAVPLPKKLKQVVCCETHTIALTEDGAVFTWGGGDHGQLGHGDVAERLIPTKVAGLDDVIEIAGSSTHSVCVTASGSVYNWGTLANSSTPIYVPTFVPFFDERDIKISHIACGFNITVAVSEVGDVYSWGTGRQLGHPDSTTETVPRLIEGLRDKSVRRVSCGSLHLVALTDRGHLYTVGKDSFGQCGCRTGELISNPTRITAVSYNHLPAQTVPLHNVVALACGERHTACVVDITRSLRDKYIWKILELLRSLLRSLYAIVEVYQLPLKSKHGHVDARSRLTSLKDGHSIPFVAESDISTMFDAVEPLIRFNSQLLREFESVLDSWGPGSCFGHLFNGILDEKHVVEYFDSLPKALATLDTICGNNPQFIGYLQECKKVAEAMRKTEPYEEENREMDLSSLLLEPYFVYERFLKLMEGIKQHTPQQHPDRLNVAKALQHLTRIRAVKDSMIAQDSKLGKAPSVRTLNTQLDGLTEYKSVCKQLYKRGKRIANLERSLAEERASFASLLSLLRSCLGPDESNLSAALEAYADLERRVGAINNSNANRLIDNFAAPMQHLVVDLDNTLPSFAAYKKAADDAYNDYVANLGKLLTASKKDSKTQLDPKKAAEAEKEVQLKKRHLDAQAAELASRLRLVSDKKEVVQWAFLRAMRSETESLLQSVERVPPLLPHMDTLEIILREKVRKEWGQHLAATVYTEMASLPADFAADSDSSILAQVMTKLDEPITLGGNSNTFAPNFVPLVDVLAANSLSVVNALVVTAEDEQEAQNVLRSVVRILDAYQKAIPLIKRGITAEVEATTDPGTLFRLNSIATRLMSAYTRQTGTPYLVRTLKPFVTEILASAQGYEVDPVKLPAGENIEDNFARLLNMTQKILDTIVRSAPEFPLPLRVLASHLMREVGKKFPASRLTSVGGITLTSPSSERSLPNRKYTINKTPSVDQEIHKKEVTNARRHPHNAVGGFVFLRFIGPALMAPGSHGIIETTQHDGCCRALLLISKVLQNLSNGIEFSKEVFMIKANPFITNNLERVRNFFELVASLPPTHPHPPTITTVEDVTAHDLRTVHAVLVKNLARIIKSLAQYKHKDNIPRLWEILTDLGDPSNAYTNPISSSPSASSSSSSSYSSSSSSSSSSNTSSSTSNTSNPPQ